MSSSAKIRFCSTEADGVAWNDFVRGSTGSSVFHRWEWSSIYRTVFGFKPRYWAFFEEDRLTGVLPGVRMRGLDMRRHWVSLPFVTAAGPHIQGEYSLDDLLTPFLESEDSADSYQFRMSGQIECSGWRVGNGICLGHAAAWRSGVDLGRASGGKSEKSSAES